MVEIKTEYNVICHGCLSNDRRLIPLGENADMFLSLIGNHKQCVIYSTDDIKLCWECIATLKKFKMFQTQLRRAQEMLVQFLYGFEIPPSTLSKLTTSTKSIYDRTIQYKKTKRKIKNVEELKNLTDSIDIHLKEPKTCKRKRDNRTNANTKTDLLEMLQNDTIEGKDFIVNNIDDLNHTIENDEGSAIKMEINSDIIDRSKPVLYAVELLNHVDNDSKTDIYPDDLSNLTQDILHDTDQTDDNFDEDTDFRYDIKTEKVKSEKREKKLKTSKKCDTEKWRTCAKIYKQYAKLIETKQRDWGDIQSYFTTVHFNEHELEQLIFVKERHYADLARYPFTCTICQLGYKLQMDLKRHNNLNHRKPGAPHKCSYCHKVLPSQQDLESHWREHSPVAKCKLCCNVLRPRGMKQHLNTAHTRRYACCYCTMTFETLSTFGAHFRDTHMKFTCDYCQKDFKSKSRIAYHIRNKHAPAFCVDCNRSYLNQSQLQKHCILMHPQRANRSEAREACFCVECDKQYSSVAQYRKHLKVSTKHVERKKQTTPCPECGKIFARKLYMKNHYNLYHLKKTKFYCELCDKYFARGFGLRVHNTHVHQKVQRVRDKICDLCGRAFTNNRTMLNHRRTHTGERPHKCLYCTAEFIQKYAMQTHMRTQHKHFS